MCLCPSRGTLKRSAGGPVASLGRQQERLSFSSLWSATSFSFPFPPVTAVSLQRQQLVPLAAVHVAKQTPPNSLPPSAPSSPRGLCWLTPGPTRACSAFTSSATPALLSLPLLHSLLQGPVRPLSGAQMDGSLWYAVQRRFSSFFFKSVCGLPISCKSKGRGKKEQLTLS